MSLWWRSLQEEGIQVISDRLELEIFHVHLGWSGFDYSRRGAYNGSYARKRDVLQCVGYAIASYFGGGTLFVCQTGSLCPKPKTYHTVAHSDV